MSKRGHRSAGEGLRGIWGVLSLGMAWAVLGAFCLAALPIAMPSAFRFPGIVQRHWEWAVGGLLSGTFWALVRIGRWLDRQGKPAKG